VAPLVRRWPRPTSLRARLMLGLLALAAVSLVVLDLVSYTALRSYLMDRVDQQARSAPPQVARTIVATKLSKQTQGQAPNLPGAGSGDVPVPPDFPGGSTGPESLSGAAGEIIAANGKVVGRTPAYGAAQPVFPDNPPTSASLDNPEVFTVPASSSSTAGYRAVAVELPDGSLILAAVSLSDVDQTLSHLQTIELIVSAAVLAALAALAWWVIRLGLSPLRRMELTANAIAAGDLSARVESNDERTEVGRLGLALNKMLAQIERAFSEREASEQRMRRFLADASHELRTPLVSIRGYAEIFRTGAGRDPKQLGNAMNRIEEEAARMGVMVGELLALARLDEMREPLREPVDLAAVARAACEDARTQAPDREIEFKTHGPAKVLGDHDQLRQLVTNLVRNAIAYTPPETPIEVAIADESQGLLMLWVRDHGPGLEPGTEERIFERFWRPQKTGGHNGGGAGLGLAIVAAIAEAHGGTVSAASANGGGAVFTLSLPASAVLSHTAPG
jgi:two-component system OmpR family sensor kinase